MFLASESLVSDIPAGDGKIANLFYSAQSRQSARLFLQSSELVPPSPSPAGKGVPPLVPGGTRLRERRGGGGGHNSDEGIYTACGTLL